jgi:class 3 adenylate cyclase
MPLPPIFGPRDRHLESAYRAVTHTSAPAGLYGDFSNWLYATTQWRLKVVAITAIAINIPLFLVFDLSGSYGAGDFTTAEARALMAWRMAIIVLSALYLAAAASLPAGSAAARIAARSYIAALAVLGAWLSGHAQPVIHDGAGFALLIALIASVLHTPDRFRWLVYAGSLALFGWLVGRGKSPPVFAGMMVNAVSIVVAAVVIELIAYSQLVSIFVNDKALEIERAKVERLLHNTLPAAIAGRLKGGEDMIAEGYPEATVMFADLVGFTELSGRIPPEQLVSILNTVFGRFDDLAERHGIEKIKTIGDAYMVACGLPADNVNHLAATAGYALAMLDELRRINDEFGLALQLRIGMHSGYVVAGVIGHRKFSYDVWGDNVNIASRMESAGVPGKIQVTESVALRLRDRFRFEERGMIEVKGKGLQKTFFLLGKLAA